STEAVTQLYGPGTTGIATKKSFVRHAFKRHAFSSRDTVTSTHTPLYLKTEATLLFPLSLIRATLRRPPLRLSRKMPPQRPRNYSLAASPALRNSAPMPPARVRTTQRGDRTA